MRRSELAVSCWTRAGLLVLACVLAACSSDAGAARSAKPRPRDPRTESSAPEVAQRPGFCARDNDDPIRDLFCADSPPEIGSLLDLQAALRLTPGPASQDPQSDGLDYYVRSPVLIGHSTALSGHLVSPINPRALVIGVGTVLAFQRGVQQVELAALARNQRDFNFYLFSFEQACSRDERGCTPADLYTPRIERDWIAYTVEDDEDLKNTPLDCRQCHRRGRETAQLLMREHERPWTHFFDPLPPDDIVPVPGVPPDPPGSGSELTRDYLAAKGDEIYASIDVAAIPLSTAFGLQAAVGPGQPLFFDSQQIRAERYPYRDGAYPSEPLPSPTWERAYEAFKRGEQLALPYLDVRATDPDKQAALTEAYQRYRARELDDEDFPDLADIYPDDPQLRARIGLQTEPDATPAEALIQACGSCHNDVLDQTISRARFNIDVSRLDPAELDLAIERISRDRDAPGAMPPPTARQLDPGARERLIEYLRTEARSGTPDPMLVRAARLGMAGGARDSEEQ